MILKTEAMDAQNRVVRRWVQGVTKAEQYFDDTLQTECVRLSFSDGVSERVPLRGGDGVYLCNDNGDTLEVLSRLNRTKK